MIVLGIETSCDETAAAVVENGVTIMSSVVSSQIDIHHRYGGVVPELASRKHLEAVVPIVEEAISTAGLQPDDLDTVAVTRGPGLVGALLVGFSFAKAYAFALGIPLVGVNHLYGHINSVFLEPDPPPFPFVALLVSGGHTAIYHVTSPIGVELMGQTRDDAAGEAYDKVAKMLGLGYPGGSIIDRLAQKGDPKKIKFPRSYLDKASFDFSFSGIKTAVNRHIQQHPDLSRQEVSDIVASFQEAVVDVLCYKTIHAAQRKNCEHIALVGGVAANQRLRQKLCKDAQSAGLSVHIPSIEFCGDNAAMIAAVGYHYQEAGIGLGVRDDVFSRSIL